MRYCREPQPVDRLHEEELERHRKSAVHNDIAVAAAMYYCAEEKICPPPWLVAASANLMIELLKKEKSKKRWRAAGRVARCRQDLFDFDRWNAVHQIRELKKKNKDELEILKTWGDVDQRHVTRIHKTQAWLLRHDTFECASMSLTGCDAKAGPEAVRASYRRVKRAMADKSVAYRYSLFTGNFLHRVGIDWGYRTGTKIVPFYDLTL